MCGKASQQCPTHGRQFHICPVSATPPTLLPSWARQVLLNLFFAGLFAHVGDTSASNYMLMSHFGSVAQVSIGGMFGAAQPLLLKFPLDRGIFLREYATGSYGAAAYFISKTVVELPQMFLTSVLTW